MSEVTIRRAIADDAPTLAAIYGHHVLHGFGTFEYEAPTAQTMAQRLAAVVARGLPYLVAEGDGRVLGYAYASVFRPRLGYRFTVEDSVYIAPDAAGRGLGKRLLGRVIADCEALGLRQMIACIGDSANAGSIALHRSLGFEDQGVIQSVGFKHGRWVDIVFMRRALGPGDHDAPTAEGLRLDS
jgi:L-amino acid N-acyltransferase YncA